jgi:hypothetical protein
VQQTAAYHRAPQGVAQPNRCLLQSKPSFMQQAYDGLQAHPGCLQACAEECSSVHAAVLAAGRCLQLNGACCTQPHRQSPCRSAQGHSSTGVHAHGMAGECWVAGPCWAPRRVQQQLPAGRPSHWASWHCGPMGIVAEGGAGGAPADACRLALTLLVQPPATHAATRGWLCLSSGELRCRQRGWPGLQCLAVQCGGDGTESMPRAYTRDMVCRAMWGLFAHEDAAKTAEGHAELQYRHDNECNCLQNRQA